MLLQSDDRTGKASGWCEISEKIASLYVELSARTDKLEASLKQSQAGLGKFKGGLGSVVKGLTGFDMATIGTAAAVGVLAAGVKFAITQAMEAEVAMAATEAVIKSTGGAAGLTSRQISDMAGEMSEMTGIQDDVIQSGQNMLLTFTEIKGATFERATAAMNDMAVAMNHGSLEGIDLASTSIQLGKALNDPIKGLTALSRVGVAFTADQKKLIKEMVAMGDVAGAQAIILAELEREFGGMAEAAGNTTAGAIIKLKNAMSELAEEAGGHLLPAIAGVSNAITTNLKISRLWDEAIRKGVVTMEQAEKIQLQMMSGQVTNTEVLQHLTGWIEAHEVALSKDAHALAAVARGQGEVNVAMVQSEAAFTRGGAAVDYAALAEDNYAAATKAAEAATEAAAEAEEARLQHLHNIAVAAQEATVAHQNLAQSLMDAGAAELAGVALSNLTTAYQEGKITASEYREASEQLMLTYGLATPASLALATATEHLNTLFNTGQISAEDLTAAVGLLPAAAENGKVSMDELGITLGTNTNPALWEARDAANETREAIGSLESRTITVTTIYESIIRGGAGSAGGNEGRASGGPVTGGQAYVWNEPGHQGEILVPAGDGYVLNRQDAMQAVSNAGGGSGGGNVYHIDARGATMTPGQYEAITRKVLADIGASADRYGRMGVRG